MEEVSKETEDKFWKLITKAHEKRADGTFPVLGPELTLEKLTDSLKQVYDKRD